MESLDKEYVFGRTNVTIVTLHIYKRNKSHPLYSENRLNVIYNVLIKSCELLSTCGDTLNFWYQLIIFSQFKVNVCIFSCVIFKLLATV